MKHCHLHLRVGAVYTLAFVVFTALALVLPSARAQTGAGTALSFDGVNDYVSISNSAALNVFPLTVMGWFRNDDFNPERGLVNKYAAGSFSGYQIYLYEGTLHAWYFRTNNSYVWDGNRGLNGGFIFFGWHHIAFTVDGTGGKLYLNGVLRDSRPWTGTAGATTTAQEMRLGRYDNNFFHGAMDEVSVWNVALSSNAIVNAMNRPLVASETGLIAYWRCDEGAGNSTADTAPTLAGNNRGTLIGGTMWEPSGVPIGPLVQTQPVIRQAITGATLSGSVTPQGHPTTAWFEWGTNTSYGNLTPPVNVGNGSNAVALRADIAGLEQGRTYHYRVVATNDDGRANGNNQSFTQLLFPGLAGAPPVRSTLYDGFFSQVSYEARPEWDQAVSMTIEAWVYRHDATRVETIVSHGFDSYRLGFSPRLRFYRGTNFAEIATPVATRKWTHVAVSYDGAIARFYINGEFAGGRAVNNNGAGKTRPLLLGNNGFSFQTFFPIEVLLGNLDEVRLWSVARSATEIREGVYREVRGEPGLAAVFPWGGRVEEVSGHIGFAGNVTEQVFGMAPRDLVVPRAAFPPTADGNINIATEYLGAEQLVLRYPDQPEMVDALAYFVHTDNDLFVSVVASIDPPGDWNITNSWLSLYIDTTNARPTLAEYPQAQLRTPLDGSSRSAWLNGDGAGGYYFCQTPPGLGLPQPCTSRSLYQVGQLFCGGEIATAICTEFRVSRTLLGNFNEFDGVALGQFNFTSSGDQTFIPEDGLEASPVTWLTMSYGEGSASLPRVRWSGRVFSGLTNTSTPLPNYRVSLLTDGVGYSKFTDSFGRFSFDEPIPAGTTFIFAQAELEAFGRYTLPTVSAGGVQPQFIYTNRVLFAGLPAGTSGITQLASVNFFVQRPLVASAITSATPTNPMVGMAVRQGGMGGAGEEVTIFGTNLHAEMEFYLAPVSGTFPNTPEFWTLLPAPVVERDPAGKWVKVQAPFVPEYVREYTNGVFIPSFTSSWRWVAHDSWFRPGRIEYSQVGTFTLRRPPYPIRHGFQFENDQTFPGLEEFLAGYGNNAYICVGAAGYCATRVPDPLYWILWYPVHFIVIGMSGGSCVGMSGTSVQLYNSSLFPQDYDPLALTANGISDPGLPGEWDTSNTGGIYTRPPIPKDIWARIRMNHGAQTSAEYMLHVLEQLDGFEGSPGARLPGLRAGTTGQAVCMVRGASGGHCVTPYRVEDNPGGTNANLTRVWIYDNEAPCVPGDAAQADCVIGQYIDIDHTTDTYHYQRGGWVGTGFFTVPLSLYNGERHAPGVEDILLGLANLIVIVAGDADAHYSAPGREWGWRADGTFVGNFPGLQPVTPLGSSINQTRSVPVLISLTNNLSISNLVINANGRGSNSYVFHAAAGGTLLQLEVARGGAGHSNQIRLGAISNQLESFRFRPETALSNFTPRIGFVISNGACATFQWLGLKAVGNRTQEFRALKSRRAVDYRNDTGQPTTHSLRIDAVDGTTSNNTCAVFGPFHVPTGAVHCVVLHDWPRTKQVRSELDLNADGVPDQVTLVTGTEIDSDGDGMPDAWETLHQLNPVSPLCDDGPDFDSDGDGVSNYGEYLTDTDPHDPLSALRLTAAMRPGNQVRLSWKAVPGRRYEIQYANGLEYVFQPLVAAGLPRVATGAEEHFDDTLPAGIPRTRFYRLRLAP